MCQYLGEARNEYISHLNEIVQTIASQTVLSGAQRAAMTSFTSNVDLQEAGLIKLDIFYQHLNTEIFEEKPSMEFVALIAAVGGNLGLFLGFSLQTVLETLELFVVVLARQIFHII